MILLLSTFLILTLLAIPIGYVMGITSLVSLVNMGGTEFLRILVTRFHSGLNSFILKPKLIILHLSLILRF